MHTARHGALDARRCVPKKLDGKIWDRSWAASPLGGISSKYQAKSSSGVSTARFWNRSLRTHKNTKRLKITHPVLLSVLVFKHPPEDHALCRVPLHRVLRNIYRALAHSLRRRWCYICAARTHEIVLLGYGLFPMTTAKHLGHFSSPQTVRAVLGACLSAQTWMAPRYRQCS